MRIDCDSCPGRPTACAGCMMNVLITGASGLYAGETGESPPIAEQRADMLVAIANFRRAMLVTPVEARAAIGRISPRQDGGGRGFLSIVEAG